MIKYNHENAKINIEEILLLGESTKIIKRDTDEIEFDAEVAISNMFFGWYCSFRDRLKIVAPKMCENSFKKI